MNRARLVIFCTGLLLATSVQAATTPPAVVTTSTISQTPTLTTATTTTSPANPLPAATTTDATNTVPVAATNGTAPTPPPATALPADTGPTVVLPPSQTQEPPKTSSAKAHNVAHDRNNTHTASATGTDNIIRTPDVTAPPQHYGDDHFTQHPDNLNVSILRRANLPAAQFVLHIATDYPMSGCAKISDLPNNVTIDKGVITVSIQDYTVDLRHLPRAPEYACHLVGRTPSADIMLNRDDLIAQDIHQLDLKLGRSTDSFNVVVDQAHVRFEPTGRGPMAGHHFHPLHGEDSGLMHWFYPPGTVILYAQNVGSIDTKPAIENVARNLGLRPLTENWPDFAAPLARPGESYYVDKGQYLTKDAGIAEGVLAGTGMVNKTMYGLQGDEIVSQPVKVYARLPGSYE